MSLRDNNQPDRVTAHIMGAAMMVLAAVLSCSAAKDSYLISPSGPGSAVFHGIGAISGGGATSKLLKAYPEPYRSQVLDLLFKPDFGAALQILKVEIGGDGQATEGTEASHMHTPTDVSYDRGYEWWLMKEAKSRNPAIKLYGLPWTFPYWVNLYNETMLDYATQWVKGAREVHDLEIDYIGVWNEHHSNVNYVKELRKSLDNLGFPATKVIATDWNCHKLEDDDVIQQIRTDKELQDASYALGYHYPGTNPAQKCGTAFQDLPVQVWASEESSSLDNLQGGACWARTNNQNWVFGNMTASIMWNLVTSFYSDLTYFGASQMDAAQPWSGHYNIASPVWASAHTTQFTQPGWTLLGKNYGSGNLSLGGTYVSYVDPSSGHLTVVIEKLDQVQSTCLRGEDPFNPLNETATFVVNMSTPTNTLRCFMSRWPSSIDNLFQPCPPVMIEGGQFTLTAHTNQVITLSTLSGQQQHGIFPKPPPSASFPQKYATNFSEEDLNEEPRLFADQAGKLEVRERDGRRVASQVCPQRGVVYRGDARPLSVVGNDWVDQSVTVSAILDDANASGVFIGIRVRNLASPNNTRETTDMAGLFVGINCSGWRVATSVYNLGPTRNMTNGAQYSPFIDGLFDQDSSGFCVGRWRTVTVTPTASKLTFYFDEGANKVTVAIPDGASVSGQAALGLLDYGYASFANFSVG